MTLMLEVLLACLITTGLLLSKRQALMAVCIARRRSDHRRGL
ncbi:MAG TPA: hypothetical protein VL996_11010 [Methylocella sp.]|nr:hypothetical protein [Methylocella sp.]